MEYSRSKNEIEYCKYLAETVKRLRKDKNKSLSNLAFDSFLAPSSLCRIENNQGTSKITNFAKIAQGLGIPLSELFVEFEKSLPMIFLLENDIRALILNYVS